VIGEIGKELMTSPAVTPSEFIEVAKAMRKLGVAGFSFRGCEATFYAEAIPAQLEGDEEGDEDEDKAKRLARLRKAQLDADFYGSAG
jgi:hypothetical protein